MARAVRVAISEYKGYLRLRWSYGKRYSLNVGLPDGTVERALAQRVADQIQQDIQADRVTPGSFDPTLEKYRATPNVRPRLIIVDFFAQYTEFKRRQLGDPRSLEKYQGLQGHLQTYFKRRSVEGLTEDASFKFRDWLLHQQHLTPLTVRERIGLLRSAWRWGLQRQLVSQNPWEPVTVKVPPKRKPRPFTQAEIQQILAGAQVHYPRWHDLIYFCLAIGCRPGEAAGLQWRHLAADCRTIWIGESFGRGRQKATKTNQERAFALSADLQALLLARRPPNWQPSAAVFTSPSGRPIDDHNFRNRVWKPLLSQLAIPYRKFYNSRHTFISHALDQGWTLSEIAAITGNSEETILRNYVGNPKGQAQLKPLFPTTTPPTLPPLDESKQ